MNDIAIRSTNLSKCYKLGARQHTKSIREAFTNALYSPFRSPSTNGVVHALKDVTFDVYKGEAIGIIGANGAGKSTLLKILSRITEPTAGCVDVEGRVGSLLEVGTGFHSELTGRENVYLNAAILGMKKAEITRKFDEIVAFAGVERFIDTPIKRYSSGMHLRLGFAVAAHLEPDILVIDEVLAVGDMQFQKKCLGKMDDIARGGRTVLFVSHDTGAVRRLCQRAIWLDKGQLVRQGAAEDIVRDYEMSYVSVSGNGVHAAERPPDETGKSGFFVKRVELLNECGKHSDIFRYGENMFLRVHMEGEVIERYTLAFCIYSESGQLLSVGASGAYHDKYFDPSVRTIGIKVGPLTLTSGQYWIGFIVHAGQDRIDDWWRAIPFSIVECRPWPTNWEVPAHREGVFVLQQSFWEADE
jgi:lipopolysaccharide transport system ATP-binding protein